MSLKSTILFLGTFGQILCCGCSAKDKSVAHSEPPVLEKANPQDGVFLTYTGYETKIIELKKGHFWFWHESDDRDLNGPKYPLEGSYTISDNSITLQHDQPFKKQWFFFKVNDVVTLWPTAAPQIEPRLHPLIDDEYRYFTGGFDYFKTYGTGKILVSTPLTGQEAWDHRTAPRMEFSSKVTRQTAAEVSDEIRKLKEAIDLQEMKVEACRGELIQLIKEHKISYGGPDEGISIVGATDREQQEIQVVYQSLEKKLGTETVIKEELRMKLFAVEHRAEQPADGKTPAAPQPPH